MHLPLAIRRWTSTHSLAGLDAPTWVSVDAVVASPNAVASPVTPLRAAALRWDVVSRRWLLDAWANERREFADVVRSGLVAAELLLRVGEHTVRLPFPGYELRVAETEADVVKSPLPHGMVPEPFPHADGLVCYREMPLLHGDAVRLTAVLAPTRAGAGAPYRGEPDAADFVAVYDHGAAVIEDRSMT
jgi:hypothetical protein